MKITTEKVATTVIQIYEGDYLTDGAMYRYAVYAINGVPSVKWQIRVPKNNKKIEQQIIEDWYK